ncbi:MAG TPA: DsbE family thiol:disulfide interchange protein [Burkholderiales bacterium]|nr:DsbE family thiol:disulfide interchange protein [Burkholderiales bacterium]
MVKYLVPLGVFILLLVFLYVGLYRDPREIPSPLIDKPAPAFQLPQLHRPDLTLSQQDMRGKVWLLNVWASWCESCRDEQPLLVEYARQNVVPIYGLDYKDEPAQAIKWLDEFGNPFVLSAVDKEGQIGINYGVYGVPETFLIDKQGIIRYKQIGAITPEAWEKTILPMVRKLQQAS